MKLSIAQIMPGDLEARLEEAVDRAVADASDLVVFPSQVFEMEEFISEYTEAELKVLRKHRTGKKGYDIFFKKVMALVAKLSMRIGPDGPALAFPFRTHTNRDFLIWAYKGEIKFYAHSNLCNIPEIVNFEIPGTGELLNVSNVVHRANDRVSAPCVKGISIGFTFQKERNRAKPYYGIEGHGVMLHFCSTPYKFKLDFNLRATSKPDVFDGVYALEPEASCACFIEDLGLHNETFYGGGSYVVNASYRIIGECEKYKSDLITVDVPLEMAAGKLRYFGEAYTDALVRGSEEPKISDATKGILASIACSLEQYASQLQADAIVVPLIDSEVSELLFDLAVDIFKDKKIVAVAHKKYPSVLEAYDLSKVDGVYYASRYDGDGESVTHYLYAEAVLVAHDINGLVLIPECMSDYLRGMSGGISEKNIFAPFSHLLTTDIHAVKDAYEVQRGEGPGFRYQNFSMSHQDRKKLKNLAIESVNTYLSGCTDSDDVACILGNIWSRKTFGAKDALSALDFDELETRVLVRYFYRVMDRIMYEKYYEFTDGILMSQKTLNYLDAMSEEALNAIEYMFEEEVRFRLPQGIIFRPGLRPEQHIPLSIKDDEFNLFQFDFVVMYCGFPDSVRSSRDPRKQLL